MNKFSQNNAADERGGRSLSFSVPGVARAKQRPQVRTFNGRPIFFKGQVTASYENWVKIHAEAALGEAARFDGAVGMSIAVQMEPAASTSRKRRAEMLAGLIRPTKYPDLDNVVKAVIDGCSKGVIRDDVLVVEITASKAYGPTSCVDVMLREIAPP